MTFVAAVAVSGLCGCSFIGGIAGVYHEPDKPIAGASCSHYGPPSVDVTVAVPLITIAALGLITFLTPHQSDAELGAGISLVYGLPIGSLFLGSAIYGFHASGACEEAAQARDEAAASRPVAPSAVPATTAAADAGVSDAAVPPD